MPSGRNGSSLEMRATTAPCASESRERSRAPLSGAIVVDDRWPGSVIVPAWPDDESKYVLAAAARIAFRSESGIEIFVAGGGPAARTCSFLHPPSNATTPHRVRPARRRRVPAVYRQPVCFTI